MGVCIFLPDLQINIFNKLLDILYTGQAFLTGIQETSDLKAAWKLLKVDIIQFKQLEIILENQEIQDECLKSPAKNTEDTSEKKSSQRNKPRQSKRKSHTKRK